MRKAIAVVMTALSLSIASLAAPAQSVMMDGVVTDVDESVGKITIKHGPIMSKEMHNNMEHVWQANDPTLLKGLRNGDIVRFELGNINGQDVVTKLEKK
jgi:Cu/Ag efflux protein CusF